MSTLHWRRLPRPKTIFAWDNIPTRSSSTSWLDGLRGIAALQVYFFHFFGRHARWGHTYGSSEKDYYLHQLPIFRSIWGAGSGAVSTFFVISGYAITVKSLSLLRQRNHEDLYNGLCSSLFRRGFRLFLPVVLLAIPTFFVVCMVDMEDGFLMPFEVKSTWTGQMSHFINSTDHHINPFSYRSDMVDNRYAYVPTSWTIPMEYYGSIVCYILTMVVARVELYRIRNLIVGGMCLYALHQGSWWTSNFLFGMWMADHILEQKTRNNDGHKGSKGSNKFFTLMYALLFVFGIYLAGMPPEILAFEFPSQPKIGYMWLYKLIPPDYLFRIPEPARWWWYWSGNLTFLGISKIPQLQSIFNTKFCQWLGKISFALYLVHAMIISILSRPLQGFVKTMTEHKGIVCLFEFTVMTPIVVVLAGVVERYIDQPSVRFAKWLEQQAFRPQSGNPPIELSQYLLAEQDTGRTGYTND